MTRALYTEQSKLVSRVESGRDAFNNPTYTEQVTTAPCWYTHRSAGEDLSMGEQANTGYLVQWPPDWYGVVEACDWVDLPIGRFRVVGDLLYQPSGFVVEGYTQATVERVRG